MKNSEQSRENSSNRVRVEVKVMVNDMPLACPLPNMALWNMHPRVFLALDEHNRAICPYCSTHYVAIDDID